MRPLSRTFGCAACVLTALLCGLLRQAAGQEGGGMVLPEGVKAVWDVTKAYRESTPTRERICINGLWRWQPAGQAADAVPTDGWGYLRVPEPWPGGGGRGGGSQAFFRNPGWAEDALGSVTAAWYQREITVPQEWAGRSIMLQAGYLYSFAQVYLDGRKLGEMRYPWGDVDLTSACRPGQTHTLSMLVVAMPLKGVMLSYSDSNAAKEMRGSVARRGLCGDVYLLGTPTGPRVADVKVETSVRRWQITLDTALDGLAPEAQYALRAQIKDGDRLVEEFTTKPFKGSEPSNGRIAVTEHWRPDKLWDTITPQNQYDVSVSLLDTGGKVLDTALPVRFGFREFWIDGRDFYLNGTRIYLFAVPVDNGQMSPTMASYDATKATLQRFKSFGTNFVYTHNYGCEPGAHLGFEEVLRAADDAGVLVALSQPHFGHYDWQAPGADQTNGYARHAEFYVHVAGNHPSVVFYSTSHNATGYSEDMNPDMIDGIQNPRQEWGLPSASRALRAQAILERLDPSRIVYHHSSGSLGSMHTSNFYPNWAPAQEMSDWFEHWATLGVKPLFTCEYIAPCTWDWVMYRGYYKGKREFGSAAVPWEFCIAEWNSQFLGDQAFKISEPERVNLRWEAQKFRAGELWHRWDYPHAVTSDAFDERYPVIAMYITDNWRAFRTWGVSGTNAWDYQNYWKRPEGAAREPRQEPPVDWEGLQRPGPAPARKQAAGPAPTAVPPDLTPTVAAQALLRNNMPLLAYIGGKPAAFTSKDHNFLPGETVEKQLIIINNSRVTTTCDCQWSLGLPGAVKGSKTITLPTGQQERIPMTFELPTDLAPGQYKISATVNFGNGEIQEDSFSIDVLSAPQPVQAGDQIALFDPKGETGKLLGAMGVQSQPVDANADLSRYDTLIVGKAALTLDGPAPDISRVRDGLKVVIFEQTGGVLEKRFGFRVAEYGLRWVFRRVPDHPLLSGITDDQLRNWRGAATILPLRLPCELTRQFYYAPTVKWCDIPVTRVWRCGNRGNVASALIEKPACGDFLPILDGGYSLQYTPLMEYGEGKGMVLFCQMDVAGRTESDPAAEALARNVLRYVATWKPAPRRTAVYVGDAAGKKHLEATGLSLAAYEGGNPSPDQVIVVGPGGGQTLAGSAAALAGWLKGGGHVLAIGLEAEEVNSFLPLKVGMKKAEHIAAYFEPFGKDSVLAGVSPADVHNRDPRDLPLVSSGATVVGDGVLAKAENANVVFCQLLPWQFDVGKWNTKRTFRRTSFLVTRLLANMGASASTPVLERFHNPVDPTQAQKRWLEGLYLDVPEEWDDPYRFFRW